MHTMTSPLLAPSLPVALRSAAVSISRRATQNPILRRCINQQLAAVSRLRDRQRMAQTKAEIARLKLAHIRFHALARHTKRGLIAYLQAYASDEFVIDQLGELVIDLERDIAIAQSLRDGRSIRRMLRATI
jgi:hypothetical protein